MRETILIIIGALCVPVGIAAVIMFAPKCVEGHYETKLREHCETKMKMVLTLGKGYQYAYIDDCNGMEEYQDFICTRYEDR